MMLKVLQLTAVDLRFGEYWRSLETRSTASGGVRLWNILGTTNIFLDQQRQ